ncbi:MAG: elongation factor P [Candidatus Paceibacterota bacterium]
MAMLEYSEIVERKVIILDGDPYEVISSHVFRKQQRKPVNATKLKNMITGKVTERSFHVSEKVEEAQIENREIKYLYNNKGEYWFCDPEDPKNRFKIDENTLGNQIKFIKENDTLTALEFDEKVIGIKFPIKVDLKVTEAHEAVRGNTSSGATKQVKVETGIMINVPMFIKEGEIVRINTETGEYTERIGNSF